MYLFNWLLMSYRAGCVFKDGVGGGAAFPCSDARGGLAWRHALPA
jgi:hypothetical protein